MSREEQFEDEALELFSTDRLTLRRTDWKRSLQVVIHSAQSAVKTHPLYDRAKAGDAVAAEGLVADCLSLDRVEEIRTDCVGNAELLAVHALETEGMNAIPRVFASILSKYLGLPLGRGVIQSNTVAHTGASGYHRMAFPALFEGEVRRRRYFLVDDFIGQGGTIANLRGYLESNGAEVVGATALTGRADSGYLALVPKTLELVRSTHGAQLEEWWLDTFGYGLERLTESEARYLSRVDSFDAIRERIIAARRARN